MYFTVYFSDRERCTSIFNGEHCRSYSKPRGIQMFFEDCIEPLDPSEMPPPTER